MRSGRVALWLGRVVAAVAGVSLAAHVNSSAAQAQNFAGSGGTRFGVFLQGSMVNYDLTRRETNGSLFHQTATPMGVGVGIAAGYDLRLGNFIVGAEADVSFDGGSTKAKPDNGTQYGLDYLATVRGRLGYIVTSTTLVYATAGYGLQGAEFKANGVEGATTANFKKTGMMTGLVYGAGLEYDLGWGTGFVEYLHHDLGGWSFRNVAGRMRTVDGDQDVVRVGLKFKTGEDYSGDVRRRR